MRGRGNRSEDYAAALDDLERMRAAGQLSQAQYDVHRAKLLAEVARPRRPLSVRIALFIAIVLGGIMLLRVLSAVIASVT